jgi:hypothetical protein
MFVNLVFLMLFLSSRRSGAHRASRSVVLSASTPQSQPVDGSRSEEDACQRSDDGGERVRGGLQFRLREPRESPCVRRKTAQSVLPVFIAYVLLQNRSSKRCSRVALAASIFVLGIRAFSSLRGFRSRCIIGLRHPRISDFHSISKIISQG